ncbi:hypothetical protein QL285_095033 [Trifolium repens]|nr:hypothetical protein QL285_095033 [Trifolium repens]
MELPLTLVLAIHQVFNLHRTVPVAGKRATRHAGDAVMLGCLYKACKDYEVRCGGVAFWSGGGAVLSSGAVCCCLRRWFAPAMVLAGGNAGEIVVFSGGCGVALIWWCLPSSLFLSFPLLRRVFGVGIG